MPDRRVLLPDSGNWYKANLHCHSTISDGQYTPEEVRKLYEDRGYSIVAMTDHEILVPHTDLCDERFLMLTSYEVHVSADNELPFPLRRLSHLNFYARDPYQRKMPFFNLKESLELFKDYVDFSQAEFYGPEIEKEYSAEGINRLIALGREHGFIVCWNHPTWSMEDASVYTHLKGLFAMEIFNTGSRVTGYEAYCPYIYDEMLRSGQRLSPIAADDMHGPRELYGGFTMIRAASLEYGGIINAMEKGDFYASQGPLIYGFSFEDGLFKVDCSPAKMIFLTNSGRRNWRKSLKTAETGLVTHAEFPLLPEDLYVRLTVVDEAGRSANTRAYFREEFTDTPAAVPDILHRTIG